MWRIFRWVKGEFYVATARGWVAWTVKPADAWGLADQGKAQRLADELAERSNCVTFIEQDESVKPSPAGVPVPVPPAAAELPVTPTQHTQNVERWNAQLASQERRAMQRQVHIIAAATGKSRHAVYLENLNLPEEV